jgi:hypothetical protein
MNAYAFEVPDKPAENPGNWTRAQLANQPWIGRFSPQNLQEIELALQHLHVRGLQAPHFSRDDFPLATTADVLQRLLDELEHGRGFVLIRGLPVERYSTMDAENIFWGLGLYLGHAVAQNADGHLLGHVRDLGYDLQNPNVRNYQTSAELMFHNDSCDVLGLMCLRQAKSGGHSAIASAIAIHNSILERRPDLLYELYQPFYIDRRGEPGWPDEGDEPYFALPVFSYLQGLVTARYTVRGYYFEAQRFAGVPALTQKQIAVLDMLAATALEPEFHIRYDLEPGDIQFVNNYCVFHSRTDFEDYPEPERKRHLLRLWLAVPTSRPLHPIFEKRWRSVAAGTIRGGIAPRRHSMSVV